MREPGVERTGTRSDRRERYPLSNRGLQKAGAHIVAGGKQDFYLLPQRRIGNAGAVEEGRALFGREFQRLFKKIANLLPGLRRHTSVALAIC